MSERPTNPEIGQAWVAYILGELFEGWPRRSDFNAMDLATATGIGPIRDEDELFDNLMDWLRDEGFVRFEQAIEGNAYDVALTQKGVAALGKSLNLDAPQPIGSQLKGIARSAGSEAGRAAIGEMVGFVIGGAVRAMSGQ